MINFDLIVEGNPQFKNSKDYYNRIGVFSSDFVEFVIGIPTVIYEKIDFCFNEVKDNEIDFTISIDKEINEKNDIFYTYETVMMNYKYEDLTYREYKHKYKTFKNILMDQIKKGLKDNSLIKQLTTTTELKEIVDEVYKKSEDISVKIKDTNTSLSLKNNLRLYYDIDDGLVLKTECEVIVLPIYFLIKKDEESYTFHYTSTSYIQIFFKQ